MWRRSWTDVLEDKFEDGEEFGSGAAEDCLAYGVDQTRSGLVV